MTQAQAQWAEGFSWHRASYQYTGGWDVTVQDGECLREFDNYYDLQAWAEEEL